MTQSVTGSAQKSVACPGCGKTVAAPAHPAPTALAYPCAAEWTPQQRWRPFCSERCRLIDLGEWASNTRRIPVDDSPHEDPAE